MENLKGIQEDLLDKLSRKEDEITAIKKERDVVLRINSGNGVGKNTVPLEKFEYVLKQLNEESVSYKKLQTNYNLLIKENDLIKQEIENINSKQIYNIDKSKISKKNGSAIEKEFLSKFIDNDEEINNIFDKDVSLYHQNNNNNNLNNANIEEKKMNLSNISEKQNVHNFSMNAIPIIKENVQQYERRMSQHSFKSKKDMIPTQGVLKS